MPAYFTFLALIPASCYNTVMNLNTALKEKDGFSENEARIADYILSHKDAVLQMPIQKLARETYTSTSAIMRLCAKLQTSGYRQFKILYAQQLAENTNDAVDPNFPFSRYDSTSEIATSLANLSTETLRAARNTLSLEDMHKACLAIHNARQTAIFGVGDAYLAGLMFQARMIRAGTVCLATPVYGEQHHLAQTMHKEDCALFLSYSGTTRETVSCAQAARANHARLVCITANASSPLAKLCHVVLVLPAKEKKFHRIASFFSEEAMTYYLNIMYACLYVMDYDAHIRKSID